MLCSGKSYHSEEEASSSMSDFSDVEGLDGRVPQEEKRCQEECELFEKARLEERHQYQ